MPMERMEIYEEIMAATGVERAQVVDVCDNFLNILMRLLVEDGEVNVRPLGTLVVSDGQNGKVVRLKATKELRTEVSDGAETT